ncbi:upper zone of growth plate and cartilage matrix associated a [Misgurnus anguillicaudatus]|uniref:upper zone of growth plate and cartilage matrix associated a n=1 Tax=Misgurnus anguillicaudatus TaxID=75329 RepID=UPI002434EBC3|nr:upper zone of growth plate and cartilage matrix associated a [Misgurnus anguillicaudatus]
MVWTRALLLALLPTIVLLIVLAGVESAAVRNGKESEPKESSKSVFMPASDASNFFKRRSRRSPSDYEEYYEQRVKVSTNERRREYLEEQTTEYENYLEEDRNEQHERSREKTEQYREFNYDGQYPRYPHHRYYA